MDDHEAYHLLAHLGLVWPAFDSGLFFPGKPGMAGDLVFPKRALDARCMSAIWALDVTLLQLVWPVQILGVLKVHPSPATQDYISTFGLMKFLRKRKLRKGWSSVGNIWIGATFQMPAFLGSSCSMNPWEQLTFETYSRHILNIFPSFPIIFPWIPWFLLQSSSCFLSVTSLAFQPGTEHLAEVMSTESWMKRRRKKKRVWSSGSRGQRYNGLIMGWYGLMMVNDG